jgi:hypothetical protein
MADKAQTSDVTPAAAPAVPAAPPPRRGPGHRGADVRDTVAEMAARAQEISQEAGSRMAGALRDVIGAAAGLTGFAVESARDLVQYMVRRGQMTQEEADRLIRDAEAAQGDRKVPAPRAEPAAKAKAVTPAPKAVAPAAKAVSPAAKVAPSAKAASPAKAPARPVAKAPVKKAPAKAAVKAPSKAAAAAAKKKKPAGKKR